MSHLRHVDSSIIVIVPPRGSLSGQPPVVEGIDSGPGIRGVLHRRRHHLKAFVETILQESGVRGAEAVGESAPAQVLDSLGAVVVHREAVDAGAIVAATGARVLENVFVPLALPCADPAGKAGVAHAIANAWHLANINIAAARARGLDGKGIRIGFLDTGIDATHPEFEGKDIRFAEFDIQGKRISEVPRDAGIHGTHVCGIAAGKNIGVAPAADMAVAAVLTSNLEDGQPGGYLAQILAGLDWLLTEPFDGEATETGVDVVNASLGSSGYNDCYYQVIERGRRATGTVLAAAIGNSGPNPNRHGSPGNYDIVVASGAINEKNDVSLFGDWGTVSQHGGLAKPDLCAPGFDVYSSIPGGGYTGMNGTSTASPVVAGALALLLQRSPELTMDAAGLTNELFKLIQPLTPRSNFLRGGRGRLDLTGI